jgi:hypothetical protein
MQLDMKPIYYSYDYFIRESNSPGELQVFSSDHSKEKNYWNLEKKMMGEYNTFCVYLLKARNRERLV